MERALDASPAAREEVVRYDLATGIALASLLVTLAQLAWQIHRDLRSDRVEERQARERTARRLRIEASRSGLTVEARDAVVEIVVEETFRGEGEVGAGQGEDRGTTGGKIKKS